ncbi:hypothetical protein Sjap_017237 [Stephania japonica]|uniref:TF-B3 domain-containing protein n=1 Tax=Stephania japonica TaxID=461633 RepID=A0AAP0NI30_9MAGN
MIDYPCPTEFLQCPTVATCNCNRLILIFGTIISHLDVFHSFRIIEHTEQLKPKKMVKAKTSYEELRRHRLEENKKRMEDLNLTQLAKSILSASPKPSTTKQAKSRARHKLNGLVQVRKSSRIENKPAPVYKERRGQFNGIYASDEARQNAIDRAKELQSSLGDEFPSFVKPMVRSHVTGCFWLGLPGRFCKDYMPKDTETVMLVDENGEEYPTIFISKRTGLSGGWKAFSLAHDLVDGDALIFQLVEPTTLKEPDPVFVCCTQVLVSDKID